VKKCQRCGREAFNDDQAFCSDCGWDLSRGLPVEVPVEDRPHPTCPNCDNDVSMLGFGQYICPHCGEYIGYNADKLHPELIEAAKKWNGKTTFFCQEVLDLPVRVGNALHAFSPIGVLGIHGDTVYAIRNFGRVSYRQLEEARNNWKPK